ncbi:hypothetical protein EYF80_007309 [Liparis tanakae]|uniref:Uncharacterized protein n=1 Tax=Liparis tanakae TaxID=230148 RepID=A0A4Z2IY75_9TELE|nr:hypothetical protein EYF80_007309 [Liparis tanakae]
MRACALRAGSLMFWHSEPQLSVLELVLLQMRPCVPGESTEASRSQKSGDFSKNTSSLDMVRRRPPFSPPALLLAPFPVRGLKTPLFLFWELTKMADKNLSLSREPTSRNSGDTCQQVLN